MSNQINAHVSLPGENGKPRKNSNLKLVTLASVTRWIYSLNLDNEVTHGLLKIASSYPTSALPSISKNINVLISKVKASTMKTAKEKENRNEITTIEEKDTTKIKAEKEKPSKKSISIEEFD